MFLEKLILKQKELRMTDEEFSSHLGISRSLWNFTRNGKKPIGTLLIYASLSKYPDLKDDVANFLIENANQVAKIANCESIFIEPEAQAS